jgi:hypothetical protein
MKNQFFYTVEQQSGTTEVPTVVSIMASFNVEKVIRTMEVPGDKLVVILDDFHQELVAAPDTINVKTNKVIHNKKELTTVQSEIILEPNDKARFYNQTNIEL